MDTENFHLIKNDKVDLQASGFSSIPQFNYTQVMNLFQKRRCKMIGGQCCRMRYKMPRL